MITFAVLVEQKCRVLVIWHVVTCRICLKMVRKATSLRHTFKNNSKTTLLFGFFSTGNCSPPSLPPCAAWWRSLWLVCGWGQILVLGFHPKICDAGQTQLLLQLHSRLLLPPPLTADHSLCQAIGEDRRRRRARHLYNLHVLAELEKVGGFTYEVNLCPPDPILGSSHSVPPRGWGWCNVRTRRPETNSITIPFTTCSGYHLDLPLICPISLTSPLSGLDGVSGLGTPWGPGGYTVWQETITSLQVGHSLASDRFSV